MILEDSSKVGKCGTSIPRKAEGRLFTYAEWLGATVLLAPFDDPGNRLPDARDKHPQQPPDGWGAGPFRSRALFDPHHTLIAAPRMSLTFRVGASWPASHRPVCNNAVS